MKIRSSLLAFAILTVASVAAVMLTQWWSHGLRFDGVYRSQFGDYYYRFYPDGTVVSNTGYWRAPEEVAQGMLRDTPHLGHYTRNGSEISITVDVYDDAWKTHYLSGDVCFRRLKITSADGYGEYRFVKVKLPNET